MCNIVHRKGASFLLSLSLLLCCLKCYCFLLFLWNLYSSCVLLLVSTEMHFSLIDQYNKFIASWTSMLMTLNLLYYEHWTDKRKYFYIYKCQCLSIHFLIFGRILFNFNTSGILGFLAIFGFEVSKVSLDTSDVRLNWSVNKIFFVT